MSKFSDAFEAGRNAVKNQRIALLVSVCAFMGVCAAIDECMKHNYVRAVLALVFFLVILPWLGRAWIKPEA